MSRWLNPEETIKKKSLYMRDWLQTEAGLAYRKKNIEYVKEWRKKNRKRFLETQKNAAIRLRLEILNHYSNPPKCVCCGELEIMFLHVDHINGDGATHRKLMSEEFNRKPGGNDLWYWLKKHNFPPGFQILCANCNLGKRDNKYCPHELRKGIDNNGKKIPEEYLPKSFAVTRRLRGEAIKEAEALGVKTATLRMRKWREQHPKTPKEPVPQTTHCKNGHPYSENLYIWNGHRQCRQCKRDYKKRIKNLT